MAESVPAENESPQSPPEPARQDECDMVVSAAAIDTDMDLIGLMSEPGVATAASGRQNNHEPQDSRSYILSPDPAPGSSTNPVVVKSLQGHMGCTQYMSQRNNDTMDIYMLQRQGYNSDDEAQYRQFMYKQWKNKQKNIIAELNERSTPQAPATRDNVNETNPPPRPCRPPVAVIPGAPLAVMPGPPASAMSGAPMAIMRKHDSNSNARDKDDAFQLNTFAVLGRTLFNDHPHLNYDDFLGRGGKIGENEVRSNRPEPDNRTGARFIWRPAHQNEANAGTHDTQPDWRHISDDVVAGTSGFGSARARNKNPRKKTDDRSNKADGARRASVGETNSQKHAAQGPSSAVPENGTLCDVSLTPDMTSSTAPTGRANRGDGGGKKTTKKEGATGRDEPGRLKEVRVARTKVLEGNRTSRVDGGTASTSTRGLRPARRVDETSTATDDTTLRADVRSCISSVSMTSSMASDIINREMESLDLLSGSSSAESSVSDMQLGLDVRAVLATANKFGRRHLPTFDKWLDVSTKLAVLQSDDPAFDTPSSVSWGPTTTQSASASVLLGGRTKFPGTRAKRACAAVDDLCAKKRSRGASAACDVASLSFTPDYSDWSTDRLLATTQLVSQSDTSVGSSMWSRM